MSQLQRIRSHEELIAVLGQWLLKNPLHVAKEPYSPWGYGMGLNVNYTKQRLQRGLRSLKTLQCLDLRQPDYDALSSSRDLAMAVQFHLQHCRSAWMSDWCQN